MAEIISVCTSECKGTRKNPVECGVFETGVGLVGDAHAGDDRIREVSLLAIESINKMNNPEHTFKPGDFAENLTTSGIDLVSLPVGTRLQVGDDVELEVTQIGKKCHTGCEIFKEVGKCIMPKEGIFASVIRGGAVKPGDQIKLPGSGNELSMLQEKLRLLERQFAGTQQRSDAHSDFRNSLIWMSQDINKIRSQIEKLEKKAGKS